MKVDEGLFWPMVNLRPHACHTDHFHNYAEGKSHCAAARFTNEIIHLYGFMNRQRKGKEYLCSDYSGADMTDVPNLYKWFKRIGARPAIQPALAVGAEFRNRKQTRAG